MKKKILECTIILLIVTGFTSCEKIHSDEYRERFLVDKIYNYDGILIAEYSYDANNRLTKKNITSNLNDKKQSWSAYYDEFEYKDGLVSKIKHHRYIYYETHLFYNSENQLIRSEVHIDDGVWKGLWDYLDYHYDNGRVVRIVHFNLESSLECNEFNNIKYDNSMNVTQLDYVYPATSDLGYPIPGENKVRTEYFKYDNMLKPNFGIDYLISYDPLPFIEEAEMERCLSKNNMAEFVGGTTWKYKYDKNGLPSTIECKWKDFESTDPATGKPFPMLLRIEYKKAK